MRTLLAILITVGLILSSGSSVVTAAHAKMSAGTIGSVHTHPMASQHEMHMDGNEAGDCHKSPSQSPVDECKCCDKNTKCTPESCACFKCFSVLADVRPINHIGIALASLHEPQAFDKPPGSVRQPPPPPPQS